MGNLDLFFKELDMFQWEVAAYTGKNRDKVLGRTWVRAISESQAMDLGRRALRITGVRGSFRVEAFRYSPLHDLAFLGYVSQVGVARQELSRPT